MIKYLELLKKLLEEGKLKKGDRTGVDTLSIAGHTMRFSLGQGFPIVTTKKIFFKSIVSELLWFLSGASNICELAGTGIWNEWADKKGEVGPMYGCQWTNWNGSGINQIDAALDLLRNQPTSRRICISAWNVEQLPKEGLDPWENPKLGRMALAPCHAFFQFLVNDGKLSCCIYQRSCDSFIGLPFNIASYALLTHMVAHQLDMEVGDLVWMGGDVHLYNNHLDLALIQLERTPYPLPTLSIKRKPSSVYDYALEDFQLVDYKYHPWIRAPIAI